VRDRLLVPATTLAVMLAACSLTRPEGDGGWSPERRRQELSARAAAAGVDFGAGERGEAAAGGSVAPRLPAEPLDLPRALALALRGNPAITEAALEVDAARARVGDARGRLLPATIGSGRYTWYSDAQRVAVAAEISQLLGRPLSFEIREADFGVVNATTTLPLDFSGEILNTLRAAQAGYRGEQARRWATTLEQQTRVVRAYFQLLEAQRLHTVTEQTVGVDRQQLANAQQRYDHGRLTKNELLVVQVALRNAEEQLIQRQLAIDQGRWQLNQAVGLPVNAPTEIVDVSSNPVVPAADEVLRSAYGHNPVIQSLVEEQQRLEANITTLARSRLPRFNAGGAVDYNSSNIFQPQTIGSGFVGFSVDLGTDTRREAQITEAHTQAERNRVAIERQLRELEAAVRSNRDAAAERLSALAAAEVAVGQAEENLRIRQQQFEAGRAESEDVLNAEALLSAQRATLASARYQAHTRRAELQQLLGLPLEELWTEEGPSVRGLGAPAPLAGAE